MLLSKSYFTRSSPTDQHRSTGKIDNYQDSVYFLYMSDYMEHTMTQYKYTVIFEPAEEGGYVVRVPALPGCYTQGETLEEAKEMAHEAIAGYLESLQKDGLPIPIEDDSTANITLTDQLAVSV